MKRRDLQCVRTRVICVVFTLFAMRVYGQDPPAPPPIQIADSALRPEVLLGRVSTKDGAPIPGAQIIVTRGPDRLSQFVTTDTLGQWRTEFAQGTGDYLIYVAAAGWKTFRKRVTRPATASQNTDTHDSAYVINATLEREVSELQAVIVQANRAHPERSLVGPTARARPGAVERWVDDFSGALPPELIGDLAAGAATTPGIVSTPQGVSALGLPADQTNVTFGSLQFTGSRLPRDARTFTRVVTSSYDPAKGWFGAAQIATELSPGSAYSFRRGHLTMDAPGLQLTDATGRALGNRFQSIQASVGGEGGLNDDRLSYNVGIDLKHNSQTAPSLFTAPQAALFAAGVAPDSVARLRVLLANAGIPIVPNAGGASSNARTTDEISLVGRIGNPYYNYKTFQLVRRVVGLTGYMNWHGVDGLAISPVSALTRGAHSTSNTAGIQGLYSGYLTSHDWLLDIRSGLSQSHQKQTPYLEVPGAELMLGSGLNEGAEIDSQLGVTPVAFGGDGFLTSDHRTWLWESLASFAFYRPGKNRHQLSVATDLRLDGLHDVPQTDRFGTFLFQSLDDLAADQPASFDRTFSAPAVNAKVWNAFLSLADDWQATPALKLLYGMRAEGDLYATRARYNPVLDQALGIRTDFVPNHLALSPRFGFTWRRSAVDDGYAMGRFGNFRIPYASVVRGGIGAFRNLLGAPLVGQVLSSTGLPDAAQHISCGGSAVPAREWSGWLSGSVGLPTSCSGGTPSGFADVTPNILALDHSYAAPVSWRGNLAWTGILSEVVYNIEGIYSLNLNQPGWVDANFSAIPRFFLTNEGRPVYVSAANIIPNTGLMSATEARLNPGFARVTVARSDLRSTSRQIAVTLTPFDANLRRWWGSASYVLARSDQQAYGFNEGTFEDPRRREWSRGDLDVRHQFLFQGGLSFGPVSATLFGRVASGMPYTPMVGADINGDGLVDDRAFVYLRSGVATDSTLRGQMQALLEHSPGYVRRCLLNSAGAVAGRNSCEGPWTASLNARIRLEGAAFGLGNRTNIGINLTNPLGGLDQLLHGQRMRGWGQQSIPDPTLLRVRGFDPSSRTFMYSVNPQFGNTQLTAPFGRVPFRISVDISIDLAPPLANQQIDKWLSPGRRGRPGQKLSAAEIAMRYARNTPDPYGAILGQADSLLLTAVQVRALQDAETRYRARTDSAWASLSAYLANLGDDYNVSELIRRQNEVADAVWSIARTDVQATLPTILSPIQIRLMPAQAVDFYMPKKVEKGSYFFF